MKATLPGCTIMVLMSVLYWLSGCGSEQQECMHTAPEDCLSEYFNAEQQKLGSVFQAQFTVMSWNVGDVNPLSNSSATIRKMVDKVEEFHPEIMGVQEDFQHEVYSTLKSRGTYRFNIKPTSGSISTKPNGNGLSTFSDLHNGLVFKVEWDDCFGFILNNADCNAKKGFTFAELYLPPLNHSYYKVHHYNLHMDAGRTNGDREARQNQLIQLNNYMNARSKNTPIIVEGDFNLEYTDSKDRDLLNWLMARQGLTMSCAPHLPSHDSGDRLDYVLYRGANKIDLNAKSCSIVYSTGSLSDHYPVKANFDVVISDVLSDLRVVDVWFGSSVGMPRTAYAKIKNFGPADTPAGVSVSGDIWVDNTYWGGFLVSSGGTTKPLAAGESYTGKVTFSPKPPLVTPPPPSKEYAAMLQAVTRTIKASVDYSDRIPELNENNNTLSKAIELMPDVKITKVWIQPSDPSPGAMVDVYATVTNSGQVPTPVNVDVGIGIKMDNKYLGAFFVNDTSGKKKALVTGESYTGKSNVKWSAVAGSHTIKAHADDVNRFQESDESNNTLSKTVTIHSGLQLPSPPTQCGRIKPGQGLGLGKQVKSCDNRFRLVMQNDGNLVLYKIGVKALWSSKTNGQPSFGAYMQKDGNLVIYTQAAKPLWSTKTSGNNGAWLAAQNDGNAVIYKNGTPLWATHTGGQ